MVCNNHRDRNGVNTCSRCGEWICDECSVDLHGRVICKRCVAVAMNNSSHDFHNPAHAPHPTISKSRRHVSGFMLFIFSVIIPIPGINYMYLGLIKRGLFFLSSAFAVTMIGGMVFPPIVSIAGIIWIAGVFDAFEKRRRINSGEIVLDSVDDILSWYNKYRRHVVIAGILFSLLIAFSEIRYYLGSMFWESHSFMSIIRLLVVIVLVNLVYKFLYFKKDSKVVKNHMENQ